MSYLPFSTKLAAYLAQKTGLSHEKEAIITYAIEVLVINLANLCLTLALGYLLGVAYGTALCLLIVAIFRHSAGGVHSQSPWKCGLITVSVFPILALTARKLAILSPIYTNTFSLTVMLVGIFVVIRLAPVESPGAPIISPIRRANLKILSLLFMIIITIASILLWYNPWTYAAETQLCLTLSILWVSFILSPWGQRFMLFIDQNSFKRRC